MRELPRRALQAPVRATVPATLRRSLLVRHAAPDRTQRRQAGAIPGAYRGSTVDTSVFTPLASRQCSLSRGRTTWLTRPIAMSSAPRNQPWIAIICSPAVIDSASSFRLRPRRDEDLAPGAAGAADRSVQRHKGTIERFGQCYVPGVVTGQVVPQRPYALGKRHERKQLKVKPKQISVSAVGLESRDFAGSFQPPQNVARLGQRQLRTGRRILGERGFRPSPLSPRVDQNRDKHGCIDDDRHVRSASRARRMLDGRTRVPAAALRLRTPCSHASMEGREAIRSNSQRRNSCMDWRCNAARAASSSRTSSGTPLMVI